MITEDHGKRYSEDFKQMIVDMYHTGDYTYSELSKQYGAGIETIRKWVKNAEVIRVEKNGVVVTRKHLAELEKENKRLREGNDILKVAAVLLGKR